MTCLHADEDAEALDGAGFRLRVPSCGALQVLVGSDLYEIDSFFSYPGTTIGTRALAPAVAAGAGWAPRRCRLCRDSLRLDCAGREYRLVRTVRLEGHRVAIEDSLTNPGREDVAVLISHVVAPGGPPTEVRVAGGPDPAADPHAAPRMAAVVDGAHVQWRELPAYHLSAENPTLFVALADSALGVLAEDSISRLQFCGALDAGRPRFSLTRFALAAGATRVLRWALYPMGPLAGYFDFVNQVRRDWNVDFTIPGPWGFFDVVHHRQLLAAPARLRAYLARKRLGVVALVPWLDYDNFNAVTNRPVGRDEYKAMMRQAMRSLQAAAPDLRCTGCMEGNIVGLPGPAVRQLHELLPPDRRRRGYPLFFDDAQEAVLRNLDLRWRDCLYTGPDGRHAYELYYRGPLYDPAGDRNEQDPRRTPMMALMVYAAPGNDQLGYWLDQAHFLLDDVGLDGIYIDQFSLAFTELQRFSYERWDGLTVDVDPVTGRILRRCTDAAWVGAGARRTLIEAVLSRGKLMVANSAPAVAEVQALPVARFVEAEFGAHAADWRDGDRPPLRYYPCKSHLGSPLALGSRPELGGEAGVGMYARYIMRTAVDYLRHGLLFYHYFTEIPASGPGSGEYGALNHMFPFTPVSLHEGWVEGRERTVTAVSGEFVCPGRQPPAVRIFALDGRHVERASRPRCAPGTAGASASVCATGRRSQ